MTDQTNQPTSAQLLIVEDAARRLGISPNAVVQRRKRGTINAVKVAPHEWRYEVPVVGTVGDRPTPLRSVSTSRTNQTDQSENVALVALVSDLIARNAALTETAAMVGERNRVLSERLAALEAGPLPEMPLQRDSSHADATMTSTATDASSRPVAARPGLRSRLAAAARALVGRE